ncbi:hypothetical protein GCM10017687_79600 [Streptomyces echinatus]|uniref:hypothetical protein n=1 Tax=Streptomyces echinatus TaxID=67293 RepID=UPI0031EF0C70
MADSAAASARPGREPEVALTGGLFQMGDPLLMAPAGGTGSPAAARPQVPAAGIRCTASVRIATDLEAGRLDLPGDPAMLCVSHTQRD